MVAPLVIDAHCHLDDPRFDGDRAAVLDRAAAAGVEGYVCAGVGPDRWDAQSALAHAAPGRFRITYGVHPWTAAAAASVEAVDQLVDALATRLERNDCAPAAGLGELGLDRSRRVPPESLPRQERCFRAQLALARERDLPIVLHVVRAHDRVLRLLEADGLPARGGMVHAYGGSAELVDRYLRLDLHLSFGGTLARPEASRRRRAAQAVPAHRLLIESDAPDMPPASYRGERNEPAWLPDVLDALAEARGEPRDTLARATATNARRLFRFDQDSS